MRKLSFYFVFQEMIQGWKSNKKKKWNAYLISIEMACLFGKNTDKIAKLTGFNIRGA